MKDEGALAVKDKGEYCERIRIEYACSMDQSWRDTFPSYISYLLVNLRSPRYKHKNVLTEIRKFTAFLSLNY